MQTTPPTTPCPTTASNRDTAIDALRGFAMLGILLVNITYFAQPHDPLTFIPKLTDTTANDISMLVTEVFFAGKFMAIFAMLFGAGVLLFTKRSDAHDEGVPKPPLYRGAGRWYRRMGVLAVFGLTHLTFGWDGDILFAYAIAGMAGVWWARRLPWGALIPIGLVAYMIGVVIMLGFVGLSSAAVDWDASYKDDLYEWAANDTALRQAGFSGVVEANLDILGEMIVQSIVLAAFWCSGLMFLGMGFYKLGLFAPERSVRTLGVVASVGVGCGWIASYGCAVLAQEYELQVLWGVCTQLVGLPTAVGYCALLALVTRTGVAQPITNALAAAGRMALSNYALQTLLATGIFYGWGFGLYTKVEFPALWFVVLGIWSVNILFSVIWLRFFRFGPLEWLWRVLTYGPKHAGTLSAKQRP